MTPTGPDAHGTRRQHRRRAFAIPKSAQAAMVEAQNAALHGELVSDGHRTVAEDLEQWFTAVQASLEPAGFTGRSTRGRPPEGTAVIARSRHPATSCLTSG